MFRDFKEYQEITKLYTEKVSKTKDLEENRNTRGQELAAKRLAEKPKTREEVGLKPNVTSFADRRAARTGYRKPEKKLPTTAEIRANSTTGMSNIPSKEGNAVIDGKKLNPNFGKKVDIKKEFPDKEPEVSKFTKQGKERTPAQMMAAKRIASGKTIQQVKDENKASMRAKAVERNQKFQDAKKSGNLAQFRKDNPKMSGADRAKAMAKARLAKKAEMSEGIVDDAKEVLTNKIKTGVKGAAQKVGSMGKKIKNTAVKVAGEVKKGYDAQEEYTPYDIVLEYLLSTEQVATIEEANYVMTEMDAETIQGIVQEKKEGIFADPKLNKKYSDQPKMTERGKKILPNLPDPEGMGSKKTKKPPRVFGDPTGEMTKDFFK